MTRREWQVALLDMKRRGAARDLARLKARLAAINAHPEYGQSVYGRWDWIDAASLIAYQAGVKPKDIKAAGGSSAATIRNLQHQSWRKYGMTPADEFALIIQERRRTGPHTPGLIPPGVAAIRDFDRRIGIGGVLTPSSR